MAAALVGCLAAAPAPKQPPRPALTFEVKVLQVYPDGLYVLVERGAAEAVSRAVVVLVPAGKSVAAGDRFRVTARETGTVVLPDRAAYPYDKFTVLKATRL